MSAGKHTIILLQKGRGQSSRTYYDFETVRMAMDALCKMFEEKLKAQFPHQRNITYDVSDLFGFIDGMGDLACMVLDPASARYTPHNKDWVKQRIVKHLQQQVAQQQ
eukprot:TRINITY_DN4809_c0_g1_i1.p2 TRINITY_DN4809_c0_g1~~TRINITY_DN4809_c0_g1_i1.p2  ORF type:complete len:107 (-),score=5.97 TRINITY_DN4809_c0_g1_i1:58-378(-)